MLYCLLQEQGVFAKVMDWWAGTGPRHRGAFESRPFCTDPEAQDFLGQTADPDRRLGNGELRRPGEDSISPPRVDVCHDGCAKQEPCQLCS